MNLAIGSMLGYFSSAYSQGCLSGGGREQDGGREEEGEDSHYTNGDAYRYQRVR